MKLSDIKRDLEFEEKNNITCENRTDWDITFVNKNCSEYCAVSIYKTKHGTGVFIEKYTPISVNEFLLLSTTVSYVARLLEQPLREGEANANS